MLGFVDMGEEYFLDMTNANLMRLKKSQNLV